MKKIIIIFALTFLSVISVQAQTQKYHVVAMKIGDIYQTGLSWNDWKKPKSSNTYLYIDKTHNKIIYKVDDETIFTFYIKQAITDNVQNNVRRVTWSATSDEDSSVEIWHFTRYNASASSFYIYYNTFAVCLGLNKS